MCFCFPQPLSLDKPEAISRVLTDFSVAALWSIGWRHAGKLTQNGIRTDVQFRDLPDDLIRDHLRVNGLHIAYELRGVACKLLEVEAPVKKAICIAPAFGQLIPDLSTISQAFTTHISRAAEKLRKQDSAASSVTVFLHTNHFNDQ